MKGSYILVTYLPEPVEIDIGALGMLLFNEGFYLYIGSAMGNSGSASLVNRVKRHVLPSNKKKLHWHIDYLLNYENITIMKIYIIPSLQRLECSIAMELMDLANDFLRGFGSSDCNCKSHLYYFKTLEGFKRFKKSSKNNNKNY
ncbi:MAG: GIY-YIG nuclease family protein [Promethearchaeota archaeon]|jgi:Uri superfamily endonuclease